MQSERGRQRYPSAETTDVELVLLTTLGGLALLDSTSIGTLVVPVWMLLMPGRPQVRRLLTYLVVITTFYFVVGVAVWTTARVGMPVVAPLLDTPAARVAQLILGIALFAWSFRFDSEKRRTSGQADRTHVWRERVLGSASSARSVVLLAIAAGTAELVTMLPLLGGDRDDHRCWAARSRVCVDTCRILPDHGHARSASVVRAGRGRQPPRQAAAPSGLADVSLRRQRNGLGIRHCRFLPRRQCRCRVVRELTLFVNQPA